MKDFFSRSRAGYAAAGLAVCLSAAACTKTAPVAPPPPDVQVATVLQRDVPIYIESIGQTLGSQEVEVRARSAGFLETVDFKEGSFVKKGDLLYTIDPRNLQATLAQARGRLASARADLARARQDVARYKPLVALNAIPRQQYDTAVALESAASAVVDAESAAVDNATIDLEYTKIYSPIDGLVGKTEVKPGNLVGRGDNTLLTTVSTIDPIHVRFSIAERDYLKYARATGNKPEKDAGRFELILGDGSVHNHRGGLEFADRLVDPTTGTLMLEVSFPNPEKLIRPGQYARVRAAVDLRKGAILVPQRAVKELQATYSVAVVSDDGKVTMRSVKPGERVDSLWVIESGLSPGEKVVVEGLQKVRDGITVKPTVVTIEEPGSAPQPAAPPKTEAPANTAAKAPAHGGKD
ncbi:MAG TPA: efflux RND transporter periplasmic adaptor subunit [Candidatus Limnocylindrales bacterium]|nr:efflux RND transporter periplasmic adaptor subunit [Candidatus Limnocylindrales bacterium]